VVNVAAGTATTDAVNLGQLNAATALLGTGITTLQTDVDTLFDLRDRDRRDMKQGVASAIAMANAPMPSAPGRVSYAFNGAVFRGEYAVGGSLMYRIPGNTPVAISAGFSYAGNKNNAARVGVAGEF
jgi:autotransporter adhesin